MGPSSASTSSSSSWITKWSVSFVIVLVALFLGYPQPLLNLEQDILPLARRYANTDSNTPLQGVKVVITGATSGIGLGLVKQFATMGATVVALGRSPSKLKALQEATVGKVVPVQVQLEDLESVQQAAQEIASQFDSIDILVNNAGIHYFAVAQGKAPPATAQGIDLSFGVNYVSHFLLTETLVPLLNNSTFYPTVVQVASTFHWATDGSELVSNIDQQFPIAAIPGSFKGIFGSQRAYANSKLAQILHARALQRRYSQLRVKSICPCWVGTSIAGDLLGFFLRRTAFPHDGFGIKSALQGALDTTINDDWLTNSHATQVGLVMLPPQFFEPWVYHSTPIRDVFVQSMANLLLPLQKFMANVEGRTSSPESYNETIQESLYQWSFQTVQKYL